MPLRNRRAAPLAALVVTLSVSVAAPPGTPVLAAGHAASATIQGTVWTDRNANGVRERGEPGRVGVRVYAFYFAGAGTMSNAEMWSHVESYLDDWETGKMPLDPLGFDYDLTTSAAGGRYRLSGLAPGPIVVAVIVSRSVNMGPRRPFARLTRPHVGGGARDSDFVAASDRTSGLATVNASSGGTWTLDAGLIRLRGATSATGAPAGTANLPASWWPSGNW